MNMKKIAFVLAALVALACNKSETPAPEDSLTINGSKNLSFEIAGGKQNIVFTTNADWTARPSSTWLDLSVEKGAKGAGSVELTVTQNTGYTVRNGYIAFAAGTAKDTVYVTQACADFLNVEPSSFSVGNAGGVYFSKLKTNLDYSVKVEDASASWISVSGEGVKAVSDITLTINVARIEDVHGRSGKILVSAGSQSAEISISQSGQAPEFSATVADRRAPVAGETFSVPVSTNLEVSASAPSWITATRTAEGFDFTVSANTGDDARTGTVTISNAEFNKKASFKVSQKSPKSLYILAIGNSFSTDAMEYLYQILQELGYKDVFLGNLYIGGCTLQTHANNITSSANAYEYRVNNSGKWTSTNGYISTTAMKERDWDFVSMQQASGYSGIADSYEPYLSTVVEAVKRYCPNAKRMWHMTWAYQGDSNHSDFTKYNDDQMTMYEAILNAVNTKVLSRGDFDFVIPSGTAVQNLRTSFLGDNLTRDGYHMSYNIGRYLTALMWARKITGKSIAGVSFKPSSYTYTDSQIAVIKDAVEKAYEKPYEVTTSSNPLVPVLPTDELKQAFVNAGYDLSQYEAVPLILTNKAYYNSTSSSVKTSATAGSTASNTSQFAATQIFKKANIPAGSVIVLKDGFQYRPEGWTSLRSKNSDSARPKNTTTSIVVVDDAWWGSWNYRAFNLAKEKNPNLTDAEQETLKSCFAIFKPKQ